MHPHPARAPFLTAFTACLLGLLSGCAVSHLAPSTLSSASLGASSAPGALLVKLAPGVSPNALRASTPVLTGTDAVARNLARIGWVRVPLGRQRADDLTATLLAEPGVLWVERSRELRTLEGEPGGAPAWNDPRVGEQHALVRVATAEAHRVSEGSPRTILAIVDTGVDHRHPDLATRDGKASRVLKGEDFVNLDGDPMDRNGHGTHCAGIAAATARNSLGIVGQAPGVAILAVRVLGDNGAGSDAAVAAGIVHATDRGAGVISLSLGGPEAVRVIDDAIAYAQARGVLLVAAMGNEGKERRSYPAANAGVLAVGATTPDDDLAAFSNTGPWIALVAPGEGILSTLPGGGYGLKSGTSMATPCVAGIAALVRDQRPDWSPEAVRVHLERTADDRGSPGFDPRFGHGRLNAGRALTALR